MKKLFLFMLSMLFAFTFFSAPLTVSANTAGDDIVQEGDYFIFSSQTATRFWVEIPLNDVEGFFSQRAKRQITKANGFSSDRADYTVPMIIRLDDLKYEGKPIMLQGEIIVNLPGVGLFDQKEVTFKSDVKIWLFLSAYNYLLKNQYNLSQMTITVYMNGSGLRVDSDYNFWRDTNTPFNIPNVKLDYEPYNPQEDNPDADEFNPQIVTDKNYKSVFQSGFNGFIDFFSTLFDTPLSVLTSIISFAILLFIIGILFKFIEWVVK